MNYSVKNLGRTRFVTIVGNELKWIFSDMINSANINGQFGDLVVEPICVNPVTQPSAISACENFHQNIDVPQISTHVEVTGSYVLDKEHGGWSEIHPVTYITPIP